jgi:hypothetical protein
MSWDIIENRRPQTAKVNLPRDHVLVRVRRGKTRNTEWRGIEFLISAETAKRMCLINEEAGIALLLGGGPRAGKIGLRASNAPGHFLAKRMKGGGFRFIAREASVAHLFCFDFAAFTTKAEETPSERNIPVTVMITAASGMMK